MVMGISLLSSASAVGSIVQTGQEHTHSGIRVDTASGARYTTPRVLAMNMNMNNARSE